MPLVFEKTFDQLQSEFISELTSNTSITRVTPGSKARTLSEIFNKKLNKSYQEFDINFLRSFLPFAQGRFLDYLGDMLNLPRLGSLRSVAPASSELVRIYVKTGTFGDLNSGNDIFIPIGTSVSTLPFGEGISYSLTEGVVLQSDLSETFISLKASRDGTGSNLGPGQLAFLDFSGYTATTGLLVKNDGVLTTGRNVEDDSNYRFRITNQVLASEAANETAVRLSLLVIPGVSDIVSIPYARGIGTFDYLIQTVVPNTPSSVINACQQAIERVQAFGCSGKALAPRLTGMTFSLSITWRPDATVDDREAIKRNIAISIQDYVNNLLIGEEFIVNELIQRIMDVSEKIKNVGTAQQAIDEIYVWRQSKLRDNKVKEQLLDDYDSSEDERLIVEPSVETPIIIVDKN